MWLIVPVNLCSSISASALHTPLSFIKALTSLPREGILITFKIKEAAPFIKG